jgi:transcriptional regulator with XRE-family HTH domain
VSDSLASIALIKGALKEKKLRQQHLAELTGLSKDHISRILLGKVAFPKSRDTLSKIARALDLDPLIFQEYRAQLQVLPESTRRLCAHLKEKGLSQQTFIKRIPQYSEGHLQLILRGGSPFPKDPEAIEIFAAAAEASPFLFQEYLPLAEWKDRLVHAAETALDAGDRGVFSYMLSKIEKHFKQADASEQRFEEKLLRRFLERAFGDRPSNAEPDDELAYLPPLEHYQSEMLPILKGFYTQNLTVAALANQSGLDTDTLFALLNGQMKLKESQRKLLTRALGMHDGEIS